LEEGDKLRFDIETEFDDNGDFDAILDSIRANEFLTLFIDTNIQNYDSLESLTINLLDASYSSISTPRVISLEDLLMNDFEISVDISSGMSALRHIEIEPIFLQDGVYDTNNLGGIPNFEFLEWNENFAFLDPNGDKFMKFPLEKILKTDVTPIAYLFNEELKYLELPVGLDFNWQVSNNEYTSIDEYFIDIPSRYMDPDSPTEELEFAHGDTIVLRYNIPVKKESVSELERCTSKISPMDTLLHCPLQNCYWLTFLIMKIIQLLQILITTKFH
ncbi:hypothetical protein LCGC14_1523160, partial [marine sediment metagenome]